MGGDFGLAEAVEVGEGEDGALFAGDGAEDMADAGGELGGGGGGFGAGGGVGWGEVEFEGGGDGGASGGVGAKAVDGEAAGHHGEPGEDGAAEGVVFGGEAPGAGVGFEDGLFGVGFGAEDAEGEAVEDGGGGVVEVSEGGVVAEADAVEEGCVGVGAKRGGFGGSGSEGHVCRYGLGRGSGFLHGR